MQLSKFKKSNNLPSKQTLITKQLTKHLLTKPVVIRQFLLPVVCLSSIVAITGCHHNDDDKSLIKPITTHGDLLSQATVVDSQSTTELKTLWHAQGFQTDILGVMKCDVNVERIRFATTGAKGEKAESTAAVMMPTGSDPSCSGNRSIVLYAHGTAMDSDYDVSKLNDPQNPAYLDAISLALNYVSQGYIVIAPNYIGYGDSSLDYHAYLQADQQSSEVQDALMAGRKALKKQVKVTDNGQLFITGYSQGGYVTMATARKLQSEGTPVTAVSPLAGSYAMAATGDSIMMGEVTQHATSYFPLFVNNYQKVYNNIYTHPSDFYLGKYADRIESLFPSKFGFGHIIEKGWVPETAVFQASPTGNPDLDTITPQEDESYGFANKDYLINTAYRAAYLKDVQANPDGYFSDVTSGPYVNKDVKHPLRIALQKNDLRSYIPNMPVMLCGGNQDGDVDYDINTTTMAKLWENQNTSFIKLDIDITNQAARPNETVYTSKGIADTDFKNQAEILQEKFKINLETNSAKYYDYLYDMLIKQGYSAVEAAQLTPLFVEEWLQEDYHAILAGPYCEAAARTFFDQY